MRAILEVAKEAGLGADDLIQYGPHMAKITLAAVRRLQAAPPRGKLVLVSAINPTPAGEGKTTVSVGLTQGLRKIGKNAANALREPSLGPIFGVKGGGTGGGKCTLEPSSRINMHFTGDLHAVTSAHNLLAAMVDNAVHQRGALDLEHRMVLWRRVLDMNDRSLRRIVIGLGGTGNGVPREDGFDITAASEVMALLCLSKDLTDLKARLARLLVGFDREGKPMTAQHLGATGAMAALLQDAILPNLVQTAEGGPAFVHGGPFGNIAHGCNSIIATRTALACADYVVTEAGFGFDLGAEKFFDIKCRISGLWPSAVVLVVTIRALRAHGGDRDGKATGEAAKKALLDGVSQMEHHAESVSLFGFTPVVAINAFPNDSEEEFKLVEAACAEKGLPVARFRGFADGGAGATQLAERVVEAVAKPTPSPRFLYELSDSPEKKIEAIATQVYGAKSVAYTREAKKDLARATKLGFGNLPICMAKTHLSLSDDPAAFGRPTGFELTVRQVRISAGAGYLLALTGEIVTMPGLPARPSAVDVDLSDEGQVTGLH